MTGETGVAFSCSKHRYILRSNNCIPNKHKKASKRRKERKQRAKMKILLPTTIVAVVLGVTVAADASSSTPQQQLRRNEQVAATADATASMIGVDAVDMVYGGDCVMMCEVS